MKAEELSVNGNVNALYLKLHTVKEAEEFLTKQGYDSLTQLYQKMLKNESLFEYGGELTDRFKCFAIGYLTGMNDGELAGRLKALRETENTIKEVFAAFDEDVDAPDSTDGRV